MTEIWRHQGLATTVHHSMLHVRTYNNDIIAQELLEWGGQVIIRSNLLALALNEATLLAKHF